MPERPNRDTEHDLKCLALVKCDFPVMQQDFCFHHYRFKYSSKYEAMGPINGRTWDANIMTFLL